MAEAIPYGDANWTSKEKFTLVEHEEIVDRLEAKDVEGSETAILKHLERSRALYSK